MRRVFHIITHLDLGGAEKVAVSIASSKLGEYQYHLVEIVRGEGTYSVEFVNFLNQRGLRYHRSYVKNNKLGIILFPFWFFLLFLWYRPRIIHTHTEVPDLSVYMFYRLFGWMFSGTKYIRTIHNTVLWSQWGKIGNMVEIFFQKHHSNIAISKSVQQCYANRYGEVSPIIYNGLEEVKQKPFEEIDVRKTNVLFAGRLEYQKGVDELLAVIDRCTKLSNLVFWIVGTGSMKEKVLSAIRGSDNVHYFDKVYELSSYISSFDFVFMPSNFEGLALMSIEASYAKVPTIINSCPGLEETLPKDWPLKVESNSVDDYVKIFVSIDIYDRHTLGQIAYEYARRNFSMGKMQREYESFYSKLK